LIVSLEVLILELFDALDELKALIERESLRNEKNLEGVVEALSYSLHVDVLLEIDLCPLSMLSSL
jgi:hypothetical protein